MAKVLVYQLYPIAWEHEGGLRAMTQHLEVISYLGADYVWLSPLYPSPRCDHGYDLADYTAIDPRFGTMEDFDEFVRVAHGLGIGVLMDLVLNHTSTEHPWFSKNPNYYCLTDSETKSKYHWQNLFDDSEDVWELNRNLTEVPQGYYYLHLFHKNQADLNWFPWRDNHQLRYEPNPNLVKEFRKIVEFWTDEHKVDGFRLDAPQALNKDLEKFNMEFSDLIFGSRAAEVINAIFPDEDSPLLIIECFDPSYGGLTKFYSENTHVDFVMNVLVKDVFAEGQEELEKVIDASCSNANFMLDLESHDSPRFTSRGMTPEGAIWTLFCSDAEGVCLYQGQELGLDNPTKRELPDEKMLELDARTAMQAAKGQSLDKLRPYSRANARIPLPLEKYQLQPSSQNYYLELTKTWIKRWKSKR